MTSVNPQVKIPPNRLLPSKESGLFKSALKLFENRQYKKGLKSTEQILKKFPEHGESLAMKGLFLAHLDRKEEGYDSIKKGLRMDLTSHICWHVYGLVYRADKNYQEAIKCYSQALKFDKGNIQILRDYSLLQIQMRQYEPYLEARRQLLELRPQNRMFWVGLAIAYHLNNEHDTAIKVIDAYNESLKEQVIDIEHAELLLYRNFLMEDAGEYQRALDDLNDIENKVFDKLSVMEARARVLSKMGREKGQDAYNAYLALFKINPDNRIYLDGLMNTHAQGITFENEQAFLALCDKELIPQFPRSSLLKQLALRYDNVDQDSFRRRFTAYLTHGLKKGIPSLFVFVKDLYHQQPWKIQAMESIVLSMKTNLADAGRFGSASDDGILAEQQLPTTFLWTLYFIAQHYDYLNNYDLAVRYIDEAIAHTPTLPELYMVKAKILKHMGCINQASQVMNEARLLDLQDRFLNSKAAKYYLRANLIEEAIKIVGLFTRADAGHPINDLTDMQCYWFMLESASAYTRQSKYNMSLKRLLLVDKLFQDIYDDQFDFHTYCVRKCTIRSYVQMLKFEEGARNEEFWRSAACQAVRVYLDMLVDKPKEGIIEEMSVEQDVDGVVGGESKKQKKKKAAAAAAAATAQQATNNNGSEQSKRPVDEDPEGLKLVDTANFDFLKEALRFAVGLQTKSPQCVDGWVYGADIYLRQNKVALAFRCLLKLFKLDACHPALPTLYARFLNLYKSESVNMSPKLVSVIDRVLNEQSIPLVKDTNKLDVPSVIAWSEKTYKNSMSHLVELAKYKIKVDRQDVKQVVQWFRSMTLSSDWCLPTLRKTNVVDLSVREQKMYVDLAMVQDVLRDVKWYMQDEVFVKEFKAKCKSVFPFAEGF